MAETYDFKIIKSGKEIEVYDYKDKEILRGYTRRKRKSKKKKEYKGQISLTQYKKELKELAEWETKYTA